MKTLLNNREIEYQIKKSLRAQRLRVAVHCDARVMGKIVRIGGGKREYKKRREQAREFVLKKVENMNKIYNFSFKKISIRNQKTRWGSCSKKGNLNFNYKIIFLPERLAEYIIAHELCHLREFNHSRDFWNLLAVAVPKCRESRRELRKGIILK
ncbi:MAG: M48 family metallopeptidase [Candidatus Magasanikbacteria bacterium]|nr:M48 family metallopeptidase [Candidatus Magasanikbacteria bacterium]